MQIYVDLNDLHRGSFQHVLTSSPNETEYVWLCAVKFK